MRHPRSGARGVLGRAVRGPIGSGPQLSRSLRPIRRGEPGGVRPPHAGGGSRLYHTLRPGGRREFLPARALVELDVAVVATARLGQLARASAWGQWWQQAQCPAARVELEHGSVELVALLDTGNRLTAPLTGLPVMVVECGALDDLIPHEFRLASGADPRAGAGQELPTAPGPPGSAHSVPRYRQ
ncbi:MAG TPA: hypothetical protein DCM14_00925 [Clostridiales bacterium UBA8153]|nr:hypothetical protein [Clostridiales bacterium UBA8153]